MITSLQLPCEACQTVNRIPAAKAELIAHCGRCGATLPCPVIAEPLVGEDATFQEAVIQSRLPVLVDFWAPWCGPCGMLAPSLDHLAGEFAGRLKIVKVNTDENPVLASTYQIRSIPTMILFVNGRNIQQMAGAMPLGQLRNWIAKTLGWL